MGYGNVLNVVVSGRERIDTRPRTYLGFLQNVRANGWDHRCMC